MYKLGIIGFGGIAHHHWHALQEISDVAVVAAADLRDDRLREAEEQHMCAYTDWRKMLKDETLDGVLVCTPPVAHFAQASEALGQGMHVFLEKPMAVSVQEAEELVGISNQIDRRLIMGFAHRFHVPLRWMREQISQGAIGRVIMFRNRFAAPFTGVEDLWFSRREEAGGGVVMDTAVHSVDLFRYLVGEVQKVSGLQAYLFHEKLEVEDTAIIVLGGEHGSLGSIEVSWSIPQSDFSIIIYGEKGMIHYNYGDKATCQLADGSAELYSPPQDGRNFLHQMQHFVNVLGGAEPIVTGYDGLRAAQIIDEFYAQTRLYA